MILFHAISDETVTLGCAPAEASLKLREYRVEDLAHELHFSV